MAEISSFHPNGNVQIGNIYKLCSTHLGGSMYVSINYFASYDDWQIFLAMGEISRVGFGGS